MGTVNYLQEVGIELGGHGTSEKRLAGAWRTKQQAALGRSNADTLEQLRVH